MRNIIGDIRSHLLVAALVLVGLFLAIRVLVSRHGASAASGASASGSNGQPFFTPGQAIVVQVPTSASAGLGGTTGSVGTGITPTPTPRPAPAPSGAPAPAPAPAPVRVLSAPPPAVRRPLAPSPVHIAAASVGRTVAHPAPRVIHIPTGVVRSQQVAASRASATTPIAHHPLPGVFRHYNTSPTPARTPTGVRRFLGIA